MVNEELLLADIIRYSLRDLTASYEDGHPNWRLRIKAYNFLYQPNFKTLMSFINIDVNYLVKRWYGNLRCIKLIEKHLEKI